MQDHSAISDRSDISYKKTHKRRLKKRNFTFINKEKDKGDKDKSEDKEGEAKKGVEVHLNFSFSKLTFESTKSLRIFKLTKDEKDLLSDLLTDIEQENNLRLYKYLHNILLLALLFIGCALYFTIVVPILCFLFIVYLFCKKRSFKQSIFDKVKENMLEIEEEYNELLDRFFIVIFVSNGREKDIGDVGGKKNKKSKKKQKKITKKEERKRAKEQEMKKKKEEVELKLTVVKKNYNPSGQKNLVRLTEPGIDGSESSRPLKESTYPDIQISSPSKLEIKTKNKSKIVTIDEEKGKQKPEKQRAKQANESGNGQKAKKDGKGRERKHRKSKSIADIEADMKDIQSDDDLEGFHKVSLNSNLSEDKKEGKKIEENQKGEIVQKGKESINLQEDINPNSSKIEDDPTLRKDFQSFSQEVIANNNVFKKEKKTHANKDHLREDSRKETANFKNLKNAKTGPSLTPKHRPVNFGLNARNNKSFSKNELAKPHLFNDIDPSSRSNMISGFKKNEFTSSFVRENVGSPIVLQKNFKKIEKKKSNFKEEKDKNRLKQLSDIKEEKALRTFGNIGGDSEDFFKVEDDLDDGKMLSQRMGGMALGYQNLGASKRKIVQGKERKLLGENQS